MKNFRRVIIKTEDLTIDDHIKVAGVLYRVHQIEKIGDSYLIQFHNVRRPKINGHLTFEKNTLMKIWNQK